MTAPAVIRSGVGLRHFQIMAIAADGYAAATTSAAYIGAQLSGVKTVALNDPDPQLISHAGDDGVFMQDSLPPQEGISGTITVAKTNDTIDAILTDDKSFAVGEAKLFGEGSNNKGLENDVIVLTYRQARDTDPASANFGARVWEFKIMPKCAVIPKAEGFAENTGTSKSYTLRPGFATKHAWGTAFSANTEGFTRAQMLRGVTQNPPFWCAWNGDGASDELPFDDDYPAVSTDKVHGVWVEGVLKTETTDYSVMTTSITFVTAPASNANVFCFYEISA
jgi:hypothetical protein